MANRNIFPEAQGKGQLFTLPAPFQGLNTRDSYNILRPDEARVLENFLPDHGSCGVRPGYHAHCNANTNLTSIFVHSSASERTLLAGGNSKIYNVSGSTPVEISNTTITNNYWNTENLAGHIIGVNGIDTPWIWDGTTFDAASFTSDHISVASLNTISLVRDRLWFTVNASGDVYYAKSMSIAGDLTRFQLSQVATGGHCVDIGSWSMATGGEGPSDTTVFIMNTGEILVYSGNPVLGLNDASGFQIVARFNAPPPINSSFGCTVKVGGQLVVLTQAGPIPMASIAQGFAFDPTQLGPWGKITPSWAEDYLRYGLNDGWSATYHNGIVYFNIITGNSRTKQYVFNTRVPAWTIYTGMPVGQLASIGTNLYFSESSGTNVNVHKGGTDGGERIIATARQGFSYPIAGDRNKKYTMIKPNIIGDGSVEGQFQVDVDFSEFPINSKIYSLTSGVGVTPWGSVWGSDWSSPSQLVRKWRSLIKSGVAVAPVIRIYSTADNARWESCEIIAVPSGIL